MSRSTTSGAHREGWTPELWQQAVDRAHGMLAWEMCRCLGLIDGDPKDAARLAEILEQGGGLGYEPADDAIVSTLADNEDEVDRERMLKLVRRAYEESGRPDLCSLVPFMQKIGL